MNPLLINQAFEVATIEALLADDALLDGCKLDLYKAGPVFDPETSVFGDYTLCNYGGYAQVTLTFDDPSVSDDGFVESHSNQGTFRPTNSTTPNDALGYLIRSAAGDLIGGGTFEGDPKPMNSALDVVKVTLVLRPFDGGGLAVVIS